MTRQNEAHGDGWPLDEKAALMRALYRGREDVHGTYNPQTDKAYQVKAPVAGMAFLNHIIGLEPLGIYPLIGDRIWFAVIDVDRDDPAMVMDICTTARHYGLSPCAEISKSKGFHVHFFFETAVPASKVRKVLHHILAEVEDLPCEVFPKQDSLNSHNLYGNFINLPLFGRLVPYGKTIFLDPDNGLKPYVDQWTVLASARRSSEAILDETIEVNSLAQDTGACRPITTDTQPATDRTYGLPPCARRILAEGVSRFQRVVAFRLAVHLKKAGLPEEATVAALTSWSHRNQPTDGKGIITRQEVMSQAAAAYGKGYRSCGCDHLGREALLRLVVPAAQERERSN